MDVLAALDELDKKDKSKKPLKSTAKKFVNPLKSSGSQRVTGSQRKGRALTRPASTGGSLVPPGSPGDRSPSVASTRRISFVQTDVPVRTPRRIRVPTRGASLASGFQWEPSLQKYGVSEHEWRSFSKELIDEARLPKMAKFMWPLVKQGVIAKIKRDLNFGGDVKEQLKQWSAHFRKKGFTVSMELPGKHRHREGDTEQERELAESYAGRFRVVISPISEKSASIYSRSSSVSRSVSGEGLVAQSTPHASDEDDDEVDDVKS
ncbi:hypothetical protein PZA11_000579 [Diplocarpon coronariae]|uniref:Uncharacterized protein n=1 Tax=Diplocarpon coronariae TaxID=2795749 RepID=A0A218YTJ0_9HELO|nr:hypothetical protein JHW43_009112 [Diplocarpon mali]OWO98336.1 hypothetical protein B2J93_2298 [Marssonina coronariae]